MEKSIFDITDQWLRAEGPEASVAVSSRARYARNLVGMPFPPRANERALERVAQTIGAAIDEHPLFDDFHTILVDGFEKPDRQRLLESRVISKEMERGGQHRIVFLGANPLTTLMVNEEDHLRMFTILPGFQIEAALLRLNQIETSLAETLDFAFSERFGYLTTCPTNVGTGLRASVMLHLPALAMEEKIDEIVQKVSNVGIVVRGSYGENTEPLGDFYQISNETTLGEADEQICQRLSQVLRQIIDQETQARDELFARRRVMVEDKIFRALSVLANARIIDTKEAMTQLSILRLGLDHGLVKGVAHTDLNHLSVAVQPAHIQHEHDQPDMNGEQRDEARANLLRRAFSHAN